MVYMCCDGLKNLSRVYTPLPSVCTERDFSCYTELKAAKMMDGGINWHELNIKADITNSDTLNVIIK